MLFDSVQTRARRIVKLAADQDPDSAAYEWLLRDELNTWNKHAIKLLEETAPKAAALGLTETMVDQEIATMLRLLAVEAMLRQARKAST